MIVNALVTICLFFSNLAAAFFFNVKSTERLTSRTALLTVAGERIRHFHSFLNMLRLLVAVGPGVLADSNVVLPKEPHKMERFEKPNAGMNFLLPGLCVNRGLASLVNDLPTAELFSSPNK